VEIGSLSWTEGDQAARRRELLSQISAPQASVL
jgi:hypothetical protein